MNEDKIKGLISKILQEHNIRLVDCNAYPNRNGNLKAHVIPSRILVSPKWLENKLLKQLQKVSDDE